jgi:hypothetical protein
MAQEKLEQVNFDRPAGPAEDVMLKRSDTIFAGTLVDPETGKFGSGRFGIDRRLPWRSLLRWGHKLRYWDSRTWTEHVVGPPPPGS